MSAAVTTRGERVTLHDVLAPLDPAAFYERHWAPCVPHVARGGAALVAKVRAVPALAGVDALLARTGGDVQLFGPGATRTSVPATSARAALDAGSNVYVARIETFVPEAQDLFVDLARALGVARWQLSIEAFAGKAGGVSSRHYDHDVNFQILLDGAKEWTLEPNRNVRNPLSSYHPVSGPSSRGRFLDEMLADEAEVAACFDPIRASVVDAGPGTVLFLPRGVWHEVRSRTDTWAINVVIKGTTWAEAIAKALVGRLHREARFREYAIAFESRALSSAHDAELRETFARLKSEASAALASMTLDEAALAPLGDQECAWHDDAASRRIDRRGAGTVLVVPGLLERPVAIPDRLGCAAARLCALRNPFRLAHVRAALPELAAADVYGLVASLTRLGLVHVRNPHEAR